MKIDLNKKWAIIVKCTEIFDKKTGKFPRNSIKDLCTQFAPISRKSVYLIWMNYNSQKNNGLLVQDFTDKRINNTHASKFSEERILSAAM
jgi:hypothetical protein